jgi:uncharacterized protein
MKLFSSLIVLLACLCFADRSYSQVSSPDGSWVGEYRLGDKNTYIAVDFMVERDNLTGTMLEPLTENADRQPLTIISFEVARLRFQSGPLLFDGTFDNSWIRGQVTRGADRGTFEIVRLVRINPDVFDNCVGDYQTEGGRLIIIGRTLGSLYYYDVKSGRTGPLSATSDTDFFGGPASAVGFPMDARISFQRDSDGFVVGLRFSLAGTAEVSAKKVKLYNVEDVRFQNGEVRLSGSLKMPLGPGLHPAVVMLHGSNAQSRNGQDCILGFNADYLARLGFAVLTYDKRGVGKSTGNREDIGLDGDALAGIAMLHRRKDIDPQRIGLWGLSQGGMVAPQIAAQTNIAFIVNVSGAVVHGHQQEIERVELQMRADGFSEPDIRDAVAFQTLKFDYARTGKGWEEYEAAYQKYKDKKWFPDPYIGPPASKDSPGFAIWRQGAGSFSPGDYWEKYRGPSLQIFGEFETYSKNSSNITQFKAAMKKAGNSRYKIAIIPHASHTMREAKTGGPKELPYLRRFVPAYFDLIKHWLRREVLLRK